MAGQAVVCAKALKSQRLAICAIVSWRYHGETVYCPTSFNIAFLEEMAWKVIRWAT
jgi:hypothetical protein